MWAPKACARTRASAVRAARLGKEHGNAQIRAVLRIEACEGAPPQCRLRLLDRARRVAPIPELDPGPHQRPLVVGRVRVDHPLVRFAELPAAQPGRHQGRLVAQDAQRGRDHPDLLHGQRPEQVLQVGDVTLDASGREARLGDEPLELTPKEFDLLAYLLARPGVVVSKRELMTEVWHLPYGGADKTVDVHLSWLRRKLGETAQQPRYLHTVRGVGVKIVEPTD